MEGEGKVCYPVGDVYQGHFVDGKREGQGTFVYAATGNVYRGNWHDDVRSGQGTYCYADGDRYDVSSSSRLD